MYQKEKFKYRLNLLLISIESINLYRQISMYNNKIDPKDQAKNYISILRPGKYIKNIYNCPPFNCYDTIKIIYKIYTYIKHTYLQEITQIILNDYCHSINSMVKLQYVKKFKHIYRKTQKFYYKSSYYPKLTVELLSIRCLYIINQVNESYGFYFLVKYLLYT